MYRRSHRKETATARAHQNTAKLTQFRTNAHQACATSVQQWNTREQRLNMLMWGTLKGLPPIFSKHST